MPNFKLPDAVFERAANQFGTPFHLYDERGIKGTIAALQSAFSWSHEFKEYFAVKALPNPRVLEIFRDNGCGLDCSSLCELLLAKAIGVTGDKLMFSANAMPPEEFALARELSAYVNLDDITDIDILRAHGGVPEEVCVRYNPGGEFHIGNAIMGAPGESKYGWTREQLAPGLKKLQALGVRRFGLHAFLSSNATDPDYYPLLASMLMRVGKELASETGLTLSFLNLSGGVGIPYHPDEPEADIARIGAGVEQAYRKAFGAPQSGKPAIKAELGRYMTGPHGWLAARATHRKSIHKQYIGLDACAADLMRPVMYGAYHHIHVCGKRDLPCTETYDVTGALCENNDKFAIDRALPPVDIGDLLVIHDTGAHGHSMGYQYNGRLRSKELLLRENGDIEMIRRAETPMDYFATLL